MKRDQPKTQRMWGRGRKSKDTGDVENETEFPSGLTVSIWLSPGAVNKQAFLLVKKVWWWQCWKPVMHRDPCAEQHSHRMQEMTPRLWMNHGLQTEKRTEDRPPTVWAQPSSLYFMSRAGNWCLRITLLQDGKLVLSARPLGCLFPRKFISVITDEQA